MSHLSQWVKKFKRQIYQYQQYSHCYTNLPTLPLVICSISDWKLFSWVANNWLATTVITGTGNLQLKWSHWLHFTVYVITSEALEWSQSLLQMAILINNKKEDALHTSQFWSLRPYFCILEFSDNTDDTFGFFLSFSSVILLDFNWKYIHNTIYNLNATHYR